jgi:hypothetical protein
VTGAIEDAGFEIRDEITGFCEDMKFPEEG